ncbi:MAG: PadR family transcriptional regulator [Clostridiales bacterium]|nr:PadR family transcriptional regulator [Clostridiales bacterium]
MAFNPSASLLDALVLSVVERDDIYGYKITQTVRAALDISESTLYPVLRRLEKDQCLEVYDVAYSGRNRRYYRITSRGRVQLMLYRQEWMEYQNSINKLLDGGGKN